MATGKRAAVNALSAGLLFAILGIDATAAAAGTCASLAALALPDTTITAAEPIPAGTYTAPDGEVFTNLPAFCRIAATLTPTSDSNINIEVWMPYSGWNGRFLGTGNGGIAGAIRYVTLAHFLPLNYAVANTDMGTSPAATQGGRVLTGHPEKQTDFATRSTNLMTVRSKQIIKAFYDEHPRYSYFFGCSTGGGQGVHEALQFPGDYDGIVAGAPLFNNTHHTAANGWDYVAFNGSAHITADQATAITAAIVKQCAGKDGGSSSDNFLTDPRDCHWDPAALQCTGGADDAPTCLTAPQVAAVRKLYQGPINPRTGERIHAGRLRGSESNNSFPAGLGSAPPGSTNALIYWVFGNDFDWLTFGFDHDMDTVDDALAARSDANTADLEEFRSHGGKLILTHGFADPLVPTLNTIAYYERLISGQTRGGRRTEEERNESLRRTQQFARLFLLPGAGHCSQGTGPFTTEGDPFPVGQSHDAIAWLALDPLVQWVEHGTAPDQIIAYHAAGGVTDLSRPICPYPALPRYKGVGDTTKASSFACAADHDHDDNQPPAPRYINDGDNYPIVPITPTDERDRGHDHENR